MRDKICLQKWDRRQKRLRTTRLEQRLINLTYHFYLLLCCCVEIKVQLWSSDLLLFSSVNIKFDLKQELNTPVPCTNHNTRYEPYHQPSLEIPVTFYFYLRNWWFFFISEHVWCLWRFFFCECVWWFFGFRLKTTN
jgi:hypothetical protein